MTPLFWCFPLIVFFGVCDAITSAGEDQCMPQSKAAHRMARGRDNRKASKLSATKMSRRLKKSLLA